MITPLPSVLVVDDEKNMRLSLQTMLNVEGYAVQAVESAEQGLILLGHEQFFMVITDARLGGMMATTSLPKFTINGLNCRCSCLRLTPRQTGRRSHQIRRD